MPRMSQEELNEIIEERIPKIGFSIPADIRSRIIRLSQGLPGYVHLLGQLTLRGAISRRSMSINDDDFNSSLSQVLEKADYMARQAYHKAISSANADNKYKEVLLACAMAESNELGSFYAGAVRDPYSRIRGRDMNIPNFSTNLANLCSDERGPALVKSGKPKRYQYRFKNPLVQPLTIIIGVSEGMITLDEV